MSKMKECGVDKVEVRQCGLRKSELRKRLRIGTYKCRMAATF